MDELTPLLDAQQRDDLQAALERRPMVAMNGMAPMAPVVAPLRR